MDQQNLLIYLIDRLEKVGTEYILVGSTASSIFGEARFTYDIDVVVDLSPRQVPLLKQSFPEEEFYFDLEAAQEAVQRKHQFNILHATSGLKIDLVIKKDDAFDRSRFGRKKALDIAPGKTGFFASPEDIILKKMEYYRQGSSVKHLRDIAGIVKLWEQGLDYDYINLWADNLGVQEIWEGLLKRIKGEAEP